MGRVVRPPPPGTFRFRTDRISGGPSVAEVQPNFGWTSLAHRWIVKRNEEARCGSRWSR